MESLESPAIQLFVSLLCECTFEFFTDVLAAHLAASFTEFPDRAKLRSAVAASSDAFVLEVVGERVIIVTAIRATRNYRQKRLVGHSCNLSKIKSSEMFKTKQVS